jgi:hypothetical protein
MSEAVDLLQKNPFSTIKANDLNDAEINDQWVDAHGGFFDWFLPTDKVSQYLLGGKGSGKTHLMRYFSYSSQMIRNAPSLLDGIKKDGYFSIYFQASGLNGERFERLPFDRVKKNVLFEYSYELWCASLIIQALIDIDSQERVFEEEDRFCQDVLELFTKWKPYFSQVTNLRALKKVLKDLSREVDYEVNNACFNLESKVEVLTTRGSLIFGIPSLLSSTVKSFKDVTFLYLIDELENISEEQQKYLNTLLREKKLPCSFRLGARGYGIKTFETLGAKEENRQGHEFEITRLDDILSESADYEEFAVNLIINRLEKSGFISKEQKHLDIFGKNAGAKKAFLSSFFEQPDFRELTEFQSRELGKLSANLSTIKNRIRHKSIPDEALDTILNNLSFNNAPLIETANIHLFSQYWSSGEKTLSELIQNSEVIRDSAEEYIRTSSKDSPIYKKFKHFKNNYLAVVLRAQNQNNMEQYLGLDSILQVTKGFPRHILTVLRNIYKTEVFTGSLPFIGSNKISLKSQRISLLEAAKWFHGESRRECPIGGNVESALGKLGELLRIEMYSDKPVECSASSFTVDVSQIGQEAKELIKWAVLIRLLIKGQPRQDKNSQKLISKYHMNTLLCPMWGLSVSRRGAIHLSPSDVSIIFSSDKQKEYKKLISSFSDSRNLPFNLNQSQAQIGLEY